MDANLISFYKNDDDVLTLLNYNKLNNKFTIEVDSFYDLYKQNFDFIPEVNIVYKVTNKDNVYVNFKNFSSVNILDYGYKKLPIQVIIKYMIFIIDVYEKLTEAKYDYVPILNVNNILNVGGNLKILKFKKYEGNFMHELTKFLVFLFTLSDTKVIKYNREDKNELFIVDLIKFGFTHKDKDIKVFKDLCGYLIFKVFK